MMSRLIISTDIYEINAALLHLQKQIKKTPGNPKQQQSSATEPSGLPGNSGLPCTQQVLVLARNAHGSLKVDEEGFAEVEDEVV